MRTLARRLVPLAAALLAPFAASAATTIADLAPKNAFVIAGIDDGARAKAAFDKSPLRALWNDAEIRAWWAEISKSTALDPAQRAERAKIDLDSLSFPGAAMGVAMFMAPSDSGLPAEDAAAAPVGARLVQWVLLADYADNAAGADALFDALAALATQGERDGVAKRDTIDHAGVEIERVVIDYPALDRLIDNEKGLPPAEQAPADADPNEEDFAFDEHEWQRSRLADDALPPALFFAKVKGAVLGCSHLATLKESIERVQGDLPPSGAGDTEQFRAAMAQHAPGFNAFAYIPGDRFGEAMTQMSSAAEMADEAVPGAGMFAEWGQRVAAPLGLNEIRALSWVGRLDPPDAVTDGSVALLMSAKRGIFSMIDGPARPISTPPFVPADANMALCMRFDASRILWLMREVAAAMPAEERAEFEAGLDMFAQQFEPALAALGAEVTFMTRIERPLGAESNRVLFALEANDPAKLSTAIGALGAMFGLAPRDFQGNQIWEADFGPALGIGFGRLFVGQAPDIENAMREAGDPDRAKFNDEPAIRRIADVLGAPAIGFQIARIRPRLEWSDWQARNMEKIWASQLEGGDWTDEEREEFLDQMREASPAWSRTPPPMNAMLRHLGDNGMAVRSTPEGFVMHWVMLKPE